MSFKLGNTDINKIYLGDTEIKKAYLGATLVYDKTAVPNGLLNNLVSYYKMDTNGSFPDAHGSNNGTINGSTFIPSAFINGGYSTDGINDDINTSIDTLNTQHSFSLWMRTTQTGTGCIMGTFNSSSTGSYQVFINADGANTVRLQSEWASNTGIRIFSNANSLVTDGSWHNYIFEIDYTNGVGNIYIDNVLQGKTVVRSDTRVIDLPLPLPINLGCRNRTTTNDICLDADYDEMGYWEELLSTDKRSAIYNSGAGLSYDNFTT